MKEKKLIVLALTVFVLFYILLSLDSLFKIPNENLLVLFFSILQVIFIIWAITRYRIETKNYFTKNRIGGLIFYNAYFLFCAIYFTLGYLSKKLFTTFLEIQSIFWLLLIVCFIVTVRIRPYMK